jgi:hypothetical protein
MGEKVSRPGRGSRDGSFRHAMLPNRAHAMYRTPSYRGVSSVAPSRKGVVTVAVVSVCRTEGEMPWLMFLTMNAQHSI